MKELRQHILEKLKISKEYKQEIEFSFYQLIKLINKNNDFHRVFLLDIQENNNPIFKDFYELPEFKPNTANPKYMFSTPGGFIIGLRAGTEDLHNEWLDIMYKLDENEHIKYCKTESFGDLKDFLDTELIIQIYDYLKQNA